MTEARRRELEKTVFDLENLADVGDLLKLTVGDA